MHTVIVDFAVRPEHREAFAAAMLGQAETSLASEPGCRQFDVAWSDEDPCHVTLYELYVDAAAFAAHLATDHFVAFDRETAPMIADKSVRQATRRFP